MRKSVAIIGAGPAGLMAAEILARKGYKVDIYDAKPSPARKFLMAGRGGLNITHSEPFDSFVKKYGEAAGFLAPALKHFTPQNLCDWCAELGEETFVGTSGRIFPKSFKASPLLRAWLRRLDDLGVTFHLNHRWTGWDNEGNILFKTPKPKTITADATILALGGASWPKLGSDGTWTKILEKEDIEISPLRPANCGFQVAWSDIFKDKFAGTPIKSITATHNGKTITGEIMVSRDGLEGGLIYALSKSLRTTIEQTGSATLHIDLKPDLSLDQLEQKFAKPRGRDTQTNFLRKQTGLPPAAINLLYECADKTKPLAPQIKTLPVTFTAPFPMDRAISTAGGIKLSELTENYELKKKKNTFAIGEMLDWEAPTGGYLLQASFSMGVWAAEKVDKTLKTGKIET
ncbi:MAG TPA: TIGR03862 family flavoprotein [Alphaproteobacteria bacterium]|nr:TIGR03862 family flavoprotein [Alphaproteobacteria bacterium]HNS44205.1 TIGR03862 family flavoprotein [Alphaproteobacteria bacterium]